MTSSLSGSGWNQFGAVDQDLAMENLVQHGEFDNFPAMLKSGPLKFVNHFLHTRYVVVAVGDKSSQ